MIIDAIQNRDSVELSYIDNNNNIAITDILLRDGYYKYAYAEEFETERDGVVNNLRSFRNGSKLKKIPARRFSNLNFNEFINHDIPQINPELYKEITTLRVPVPFSIDIEVLPTDEHGYSKQTEALNPITSISITDIQCGSIQFIVKNPDHPEISDSEMEIIDNKIRTLVGDEIYNKWNLKTAIRVFDTEKEMIETFLECMRKYFTSIFGWNFIGYDWLYIYNRCENLGIDVKFASPKNKTVNKSFNPNKKNKTNDTRINYKIPTHRIIQCYMNMFQTSLVFNNRGSYSLNDVASDILGIGKFAYTGNLRKLYKDDFLGFLAYGFIDTILVMLIHHKVKLYDVEFFESHMNKIPFLKISQNGISGAMIYNQLRSEGKFLSEEEFSDMPKQKYPGGYVKMPIRKIILSLLGLDYSALYPNGILTYELSPERYVDSIKVNPNTNMPLNDAEEQKWFKYRNMNCVLAPTGRIYSRNNADGVEEKGLYGKIEAKKQEERGIFKSIKNKDLFLGIMMEIDEKLKEFE